MPTIYIPVYEHGRRTVWEIVPRWNCFADRFTVAELVEAWEGVKK